MTDHGQTNPFITLSFPVRSPGLAVIQAHGTGLDGAVYVGRLVRQVPRPGVARGWTAELWALPCGEDDEEPGEEASRLTTSRLRDLEGQVRERLARGGPWWAAAPAPEGAAAAHAANEPDPDPERYHPRVTWRNAVNGQSLSRCFKETGEAYGAAASERPFNNTRVIPGWCREAHDD